MWQSCFELGGSSKNLHPISSNDRRNDLLSTCIADDTRRKNAMNLTLKRVVHSPLAFTFLVAFSLCSNLLLESRHKNNEHPGLLASRSPTKQTPVNNKKPTFVIHVGPPKTATTTLQQSLVLEYSPFLKQDNYTYLGNRAGLPVPPTQLQTMLLDLNCQRKVAEARHYNDSLAIIPCWMSLKKELHSWKGQNVILSHENMASTWHEFQEGPGPFDWVSIKSLLSNWNVVIVVGYRRFVEWIPSCIYEEEKPGKKPRRHLWQSQGGKHPDPFLPKLQNYIEKKEARMFRYTDSVMNVFGKHFTVEILNIHDPRGVLMTFLCDILPNADNACHHSLQSTKSEKRANAASQEQAVIDYDRIVTAATDAGLLNTKTLSRDSAVDRTRLFHEQALHETASNLPVVCLEEAKLSSLLEQSLDLERRVVPQFYASELGERAHQESFSRMVHAHKFCSVDTNAVLRNETWRQFFANLSTAGVEESS